MADRSADRLVYRAPGAAYVDGVLEDPGNDAVIATFTHPGDAATWGKRIQDALEFHQRLLPWLKGVAKTSLKGLDGGDYSELAGGWRDEARDLVAGRPATGPGQEPAPATIERWPADAPRRAGEYEVVVAGEVHNIRPDGKHWTIDTFDADSDGDAIDSQTLPSLDAALEHVLPSPVPDHAGKKGRSR